MSFLDLMKIVEIIKKIFNFLGGAKELFLVYRDGKINLCSSFWRAFPMICIAIIYWQFLKQPIYYKMVKSDDVVYKSITTILKSCGKYSFISWTVLDGKKNLRFKDVLGCVNDKEQCISSVKYDNKNYQEEHFIDLNTQDLIESTQEGRVMSIENIIDARKYDTLYRLLTETNLPLKSAKITLVRDYKNNIIYAFILSFATIADFKCQDSGLLLLDLARIAKENL